MLTRKCASNLQFEEIFNKIKGSSTELIERNAEVIESDFIIQFLLVANSLLTNNQNNNEYEKFK